MNRALIVVVATATLAAGYLVWGGAGQKASAAAPSARACPPLRSILRGGVENESVIDVMRLPDRTADVDERVASADAGRRDLRARAGITDRPASVEVFVGGTMHGGRTSLAARRDSGDWRVESITENGFPLPLGVTADSVAIKGQAAKRLNRLLADPCLYAEPAYIGDTAPLVGGSIEECYDGGDTVVVINHDGRTRKAFQACKLRGKTGELASLLLEAVR